MQLIVLKILEMPCCILLYISFSFLLEYYFQVRMKAVCVLEAMLRKKDDDHFSLVTSYFTENKDVVLRCSESPQSSLREKAVKVTL